MTTSTTPPPKPRQKRSSRVWRWILDHYAPEMYWDDDVSTLDRLDSGRYHH